MKKQIFLGKPSKKIQETIKYNLSDSTSDGFWYSTQNETTVEYSHDGRVFRASNNPITFFFNKDSSMWNFTNQSTNTQEELSLPGSNTDKYMKAFGFSFFWSKSKIS